MNRGYLAKVSLSLLVGCVVLFGIVPAVAGPASPFPRIGDIVGAVTGEEGSRLASAFGNTLVRFMLSTVIGCGIGVFLGTAQAGLPWTRGVLSPWLDAMRVTPAIVWIPILLTFRHVSTGGIPLVLGILYSALYVALHVESRVADISLDELTFIRAQRVGLWWKIKYCYLPRVVAGTATGLKVGGSIGLILVVVGEALVRVNGTGNLVVGFMESYAQGPLWATIILLGALALSAFHLFGALEGWMLGKAD